MRRISSVESDKWPQLAKTEIIYRTKMTQMKGKEQEITKIMKAKEDKNVEVELAYKNEKMLRKGPKKTQNVWQVKLKC